MLRFVLLGLPLVVLVLALAEFFVREAVSSVSLAGSFPWAWRRLVFEGAALIVLFVWLETRARSWIVQGFTVGLIAWLFRGPLFALLWAERAGGARNATGLELSLILIQELLAAWALAFLFRTLRRRE